MLDHILQQAQAFERRHGRRPNVLYLSHEHLARLREAVPGLFRGDPEQQIGLRVAVLPDHMLVHPEVAWLPPRRRAA